MSAHTLDCMARFPGCHRRTPRAGSRRYFKVIHACPACAALIDQHETTIADLLAEIHQAMLRRAIALIGDVAPTGRLLHRQALYDLLAAEFLPDRQEYQAAPIVRVLAQDVARSCDLRNARTNRRPAA